MSFIDEVRAKRQKLADVLKDEEYSGIREIVEELYPDQAHFIYELLQNAEDANATEVAFMLTRESVVFEHNGRPFDEKDVEAITNIGKGSKKEQADKIGKFGVGFKAVFAYTDSPHIWSQTYSFKVTDLVLPHEIPGNPSIGCKTRFKFPFNNPKKPRTVAFKEVKSGLEELSETTLLFLSHIESIRWETEEGSLGQVLRIQHSDHHIEVLMEKGSKQTRSSHFLRFSQPVEHIAKQKVSLAFALEFLPPQSRFDAKQPLAKQLRIIPCTPGRVSVFFPAEKETSGLRFHLHGPFVPELSRASIKETAVNDPLFVQLSKLAADSLYAIRDLKLLTAEFLGVLPNPQDEIPSRYESIRQTIIDKMKNEPLTPTYSKAHAPAKYLLQAKASLKELLSKEDLEFLVDTEEEDDAYEEQEDKGKVNPYQWSVSAPQKNSNSDRFIQGLEIEEWDVFSFIRQVRARAHDCLSYSGETTSIHAQDFCDWMSSKSPEWHQQFYALLYREVESEYLREDLGTSCIVRLSDGSYGAGEESYFPSDDILEDSVHQRVDNRVLTCGRSKSLRDDVREFLVAVGVREVEEIDHIRVILEQRYTQDSEPPSSTTHIRDLRKFFALIEDEDNAREIFGKYFVFKTASEDWRTPMGVFLDMPFMPTRLRAFYTALGDDATRVALSDWYNQKAISKKKLIEFAEAVGVQTRLEVDRAFCDKNPDWDKLSSYIPGGRRRGSSLDEDYAIEGLDCALSNPTVDLAKLIWETMTELPECYLMAKYGRNVQGGYNVADSQLVHLLKSSAWVPLKDKTFVCPADASKRRLIAGLAFDESAKWLESLGFGELEQQQAEEAKSRRDALKSLGIPNEKILKKALWFAKLDPNEQSRIQEEVERRSRFELPGQESRLSKRRIERVAEQAHAAPERASEKRLRSVPINCAEVKVEAEDYLRQQYTNGDGETICQVCQDRLPFKLNDGVYYMEKVELLSNLSNRHYQNYVAMCPNHAAMYMHANGLSPEETLSRIRTVDGNQVEILLAEEPAKIYFTGTHLADLKTVIEVDTGGKSDDV